MQINQGIAFFGRLLLSIIFIISGIAKALNFADAKLALELLSITPASIYIFIALLLELVGGTLLFLGWHTRMSCLLLLLFLLPTTLIFHSFWQFEGFEAGLQFSLFLRNLAIFGGLLLVYALGPGEWSIDAQNKE